MTIKLMSENKEGHAYEINVISCVVSPHEDSAVVETVEHGAMVISRMDYPKTWDNFIKKTMYQTAKVIADVKMMELEAARAVE